MGKLNVPKLDTDRVSAAMPNKSAEPKNVAVLDFVALDDNLVGFEQITQETMGIPFIRILQKLSPQLDKNESEYLEDAEEGLFFNTITKEVYGSSIACVVLKFEHVYIEWRPNRGGFVGYHSVENAARIAVDKTFGKWETKDGNLLQENYVYLLLIKGHEKEGIVVFPLASSMIKTAREWNRLMTTHLMDNGQKALPYYLVWSIKTEYKSNEKGNWYIPVVSLLSYVNKEQYDVAKSERKMLPTRQVDYAQIKAETTESVDDDVPF